jgi:hypothetical protein
MTQQEALVMAKGNPVVAKMIYEKALKDEVDKAKITEAVKTATKEAVKEIKEEAKTEAKTDSTSTDETSDKMFGIIPKKVFWIGTGVLVIGTLLFIFRKRIL